MLADTPCIRDCLYGLPISWFRRISKRHQPPPPEVKRWPSRNNWLASSLRAFYQALYNSCWRSRNDLALRDEEANGNPIYNRRLMKLP